MPGPDTSNRERLLRLIDGGADAIREVAEERSAKPVETPSPVASSAAAEATPKVAPAPVQASPAAKGSVKIHPVTRWLVPIILVALVLLGVGLVSQFIDSLRQKPVQPAVEGAAAAPEPAVLASPVDEGAALGLRLVGVDSSEPPVALIEDLATGKTYFARKNDKIKNVRVKDIQRNKIEVTVNGRTVELR